MDENFAIWLPVIFVDQLAFTGQTIQVEQFCEGHILYNGRLMCDGIMEVILNSHKTKKFKKVGTRPPGVKICPVCADKYKKNPNSALYAWVEGKPKTPVVKLPEMKTF